MEAVRYLIVGGGIAGTTAAETLRQHDAEGRIGIVSSEPHRLYSRILLSKPRVLLGDIPLERLWLKDDAWYREQQVALLRGRRATGLDAKRKTVTLDDGRTITYEKLLLALGTAPRVWAVPGADKDGVVSLQTLDDAQAIISRLPKVRRAVVVGGGFIAFEVCDILRRAGVETVLTYRTPRFWESLLDTSQAEVLEEAMSHASMRLYANCEVVEVLGGESVEGVRLSDGTRLPCEMVVVGVGVTCPVEWLASSGLAVEQGILTDAYLQTSVPDVWAAGDAAEFDDVITGRHRSVGNWAHAREQGRVAALNMLGKKEIFQKVPAYTTQGFGMRIAFVGDMGLRDDVDASLRSTSEHHASTRLFRRGEALVGAVLMNQPGELSSLIRAIAAQDIIPQPRR